MSQLIQLLIGRELARGRGIEDPGQQFRIGAIAAVMPNPIMGLVVATTLADREAPVPKDVSPPRNDKPPVPTPPPDGPPVAKGGKG